MFNKKVNQVELMISMWKGFAFEIILEILMRIYFLHGMKLFLAGNELKGFAYEPGC